MNAVASLSWFLFYHPPTFNMKHRRQSKMKFIKDFDYFGTFLVTLGLLLFLMGLSWGGAVHPWKSAHVISAIVVGAVLLIVFGLWETFRPLKEALLPVRILKDRGFNISVALWALGASAYYALAIIWPQMLVTLYADQYSDPMWVGYAAAALPSGICVGEIIGAVTKKWVHWSIRVVFFSGSALMACKLC